MKRYALVVGIGNYISPNLPALSKPATDAKAVAELLKAQGGFENVELLNGGKAKPGWVDYASFEQALTQFLKQADNQDALIYFTGHGFTVEESEFAKRGYLATSNCKVEIREKQIISQVDGLSFEELNGRIQKANLSSLLMLLDCCHSGFLIEDNLVKDRLQAFSKTNYCLIAACRSFQEAYALKREENSVFTGALLDSLLPDKAKDGVVKAFSAFEFIEAELKQSGQEPIFLGMGGAIPIVKYQAVMAVAPDETCPYQGLEAFTAETAKFFFGRQRDVEALWQRLEQRNFVPVIGASGSGKSSLVRAGLIPALQQSGGNWTVLEPIKPGEEPLTQLRPPLEELARQVVQGSAAQGVGRVKLAGLIRTAPEGLQPLIEQLPPERKFLLVVDQFEELFTVCLDADERGRFIGLMTQVAELADSRLAVVVTMRADFVEPCLQYGRLKALIQTQAVYLSPLTGPDLTDAIAKPAEQQGYRLTPDLLSEIVNDCGKEPGFLPLLQFALTQLWEYRDGQSHELTAAAYLAIGKLAGALNAHAEQIYGWTDYIDADTGEINAAPTVSRGQAEQDWIRAMLLRLVRPGAAEKDTRQRQPQLKLVELAGETAAARQQIGRVLESLIKGRLLVSEQDGVDLAHEALIQGWERLALWCKESQELRQLSQRLEMARLDWEKDQQNLTLNPADKDRNLMMGGLLAEVREQWKVLVPYLQDTDKDTRFWQRSDAHEQDRITTLQRALTESRLREQAARALHTVLVQARAGLELAVQAIGENQENFPEQLLSSVQGSLNQAMNLARLPNRLKEHKAFVRSVAFSPDSNTIVSGSDDKTIRLWDREGNPIGQPFVGHENYVYSVAFSPDGNSIVSGSRDKTIRLWDREGNPIGQPFVGHESSVRSVAFSPDGNTIVSGSADDTIRLWDRDGNPIGQPFAGHKDSVRSVAFSPDGNTIVSGSRDKTIRLWDREGNPIGQPFVGHKDYVRSVAFSPDGNTIVSGSRDKTIRLWDREGNPIGQPFVGHKDSVRSVAFSPDGNTIVSGSEDKTIRLWGREGNPIGQPFVGHESHVMSVAFSPDGNTIVSGSEDKTIRLWGREGNPIGQPFVGHKDSVNSVVFSPDGNSIVSGSRDSTIRLWGREGNPIGQPFVEHENYVNSVAFSPDGNTIVSGSRDTIRLWGREGNPIGQPFVEYVGSVYSVAFSPDGNTIVSGSDDDTIRLWDREGNPIGQPFVGHENYVNSVAFSPDGNSIVSGSDDKIIRLWDREGNPIGQPFVGHEDYVTSVAFSPDGNTIVSGSRDKTIRLWDRDGNPIGQPFVGHEGFVNSVAFSPDGHSIVSGSNDNTIRLWDRDGNPVGQPFVGHEGFVSSVAFSPDGHSIVSGSGDNTIRLWRGDWQSWLDVCCQRLGYHLVSEHPDLEITTADPKDILRSKDSAITTTQKACATCQKYAWSNEAGRQTLARILRRQANDLARAGQPEQAAAKLQQAIAHDPQLRPELEPLAAALTAQ